MLIEINETEFRKEHGASVSWNDSRRPDDLERRWLFETGAVMTQVAGQPPAFIDPPSDAKERLELQKQFHDIRAGSAKAAFSRLKAASLGYREHGLAIVFKWDEQSFGPAPPDKDPVTGQRCAIAALQKLKRIHQQHVTAAARIEKQIADLPEVKEARRHAKAEAARQAREQARRRELDELREQAVRAIRLDDSAPPTASDELERIRDDMNELRCGLQAGEAASR